MRSILLLLSFLLSFVGFGQVCSYSPISNGSFEITTSSLSPATIGSSNIAKSDVTYSPIGYIYIAEHNVNSGSAISSQLVLQNFVAPTGLFSVSAAQFSLPNNVNSFPLSASGTASTNYANVPAQVTTIGGLAAGTMYWIRFYAILKINNVWQIVYSAPISAKTYPTPPSGNAFSSICPGITTVGQMFTPASPGASTNTTYNIQFTNETNSSVPILASETALMYYTYGATTVATYPDQTQLSSSMTSTEVNGAYDTPSLPTSLAGDSIYSLEKTFFSVQVNGNSQEIYWLSNTDGNIDVDPSFTVFYEQFDPSVNLQIPTIDPVNTSEPLLVNSTRYYTVVIVSACGDIVYEPNLEFPVFRLPTPDNTGHESQVVCSTSQIWDLYNPGTVTIDSRNYTWAFFPNTSVTTPFVGSEIVQTGQYIVRYKLVEGGNTYYSDTYTTVDVVAGSIYIGPTGSPSGPINEVDFNDPNNWCPNTTVPSAPILQPGQTIYLDGSYEYENLTVACGGSLIITETGRVTITNVLTNNGIVHVINGGTIHYGTTAVGECPGTYEITQNFAPSRFWYVGPTTTNTVRTDFGSVASTNNPNGTQMWSWNESANASNGYIAPLYSSGTTLIPGKGYVYRNLGATTLDVNVTGPYITTPISHTGLTRTGTGPLAGYHLISNPYTAYLDANEVFSQANTGTTNMEATLWVRSNSSSNGGVSTMVFDTYNATLGEGTGLGWQTAALNNNFTAINSLMRWIAPMQGFWVRVNSSGNGSVAYDYSMATANPTGAGQLKTTSPISGLARLNITFGSQKDQMVAALSSSAGNGFEAFDSEKMFTSGVVQLYAPNSGKKLAINTLKDNKSKISMPLSVECPSNGWYTFDLAELRLENGVVFLEDKLNGEMKDLTIDSSYQFYANSGVLQNRFILHFHLPSAISNVTGPTAIEDLVSESQSATIDITSTGSGKVTVALDQVDEVTNSAVRICDLNGRVVDSFMADGKSFEFQINQGQGAYLIEVTNGLTVEKKKVFIQ